MSSKRSQNGSRRRDLIVIGASAGGIEALKTLVRGLPADLPASVFIVNPIHPTSPSILPQILERFGNLPVEHAVQGEEIRQGRIYVAPPDCHMIVDDGHIRLHRGPKENFSRPAIDPLFRSAAHHYG